MVKIKFKNILSSVLKHVLELCKPVLDEYIKNNIHNICIADDLEIEDPVHLFPYIIICKKCKIGAYTYMASYSYIGEGTTIGKYCSIACNVAITPTQHPKSFLSTHPF